MRDRAELVIIGGGVVGLSLAYHLARLGMTDVMVLEQGFLCYGASGRNGGGVRQQWSTEDHILLAKQSVKHFRNLAAETKTNIWFRQGGYLFLARDDKTAKYLKNNAKLQNNHGIATRVISAKAAKRVVPDLNVEGIELCAYNPTDGVLFPWPALWGMAKSVTKRGIEINTFTKVTAIEKNDRRITAVLTDKGRVATNLVINAAGAWSGQIAEMAGVKLPNKPYRHEILVSEPLRPFLDPMVSDLKTGTYFSQTMRGEILGGISDSLEPSSMSTDSSFRFLSRMCGSMIKIMPRLAGVKILRQWAGYYDETPDGQPILGRVDEVDGFIQMNGFGGHGFMLAPAMGEIAAKWLLRKSDHEVFTKYNLDRFKRGEIQKETFVIG